MNTKIFLSLLLASLFSFALSPATPLGDWQKERAELLASYKATGNSNTLKKIHAVEDQVIAYIYQNGYKVVMNTRQAKPTVVVTDPNNVQKVLATLEKGNTITIYKYHKKYAFYIQTQAGIKGFINHYDFSPSVNTYPLDVLISKTKAIDPPPSSSRKSTTPNNGGVGCSSTRCTGQTQKGTRCKRITTSCNRRCFQH